MHLSTATAGLVALASVVSGQSVTQVNDFTQSPTKLKMYVKVGKNLKTPAPIVVAVHHCQGSATGYSGNTKYPQLADTHGFIAIYPNSRSSGGCFDVASAASKSPFPIFNSLKHDGGGDSQTIANMVKYAITKYNGDPKRVYVVGTSSGAMMTNVLLATYPDVFAAGSVYSGVPAGCFSVSGATATQDPPGWSNSCANGQLSKTGAEWGNIVRSAYPGFNGTRPRIQIFHGTSDNTLNYKNYQEQLKQWSNVFGLTASKNAANTPKSGWTQTIYGDGTATTAQVVGYSAQGVGHSVPQQETMDLAFFGIA